MTCESIQAQLDQWLEGELSEAAASDVRQHLEQCPACREQSEVLGQILDTTSVVRRLEPPPGLTASICSSPCQRWQTLLFAAIDQELPEDTLERLLQHVDSCPSCRRAWTDVTLARQAGTALVPPPELIRRCGETPHTRARRAPVGVRTALAVAYALAVAATLLISSPLLSRLGTSLADPGPDAVVEVAHQDSSGVEQLLSRAWQWGEETLAALADLIDLSQESPDENDDTTVATPTPAPENQG